jgi:hypothetical protein
MSLLTATYIYDGLPDYWGGNGDRWNDNAGCVFAYYGPFTTLRDIVDGAVDDFCAGGDCDTMPEEVTEEMVRAALLDCLTDAGRADYDSGAVAEVAAEYADVNGYNRCDVCGEMIGEPHDEGCSVEGELVVEEDCYDDDEFSESPFCVFLLECSVCPDCGKLADTSEYGCCAECQVADVDDIIDDSVEATDVVFLRYPDSRDIFAVFPGIAATAGKMNHALCYEHVGQHGAVYIRFCNECTELTDPADYRDLASELCRIGYVLNVVRLARIKDAGYYDSRAEQMRPTATRRKRADDIEEGRIVPDAPTVDGRDVPDAPDSPTR